MDKKINEPLTDTCQMPFGIHKGKNMEEIPSEYLMFLLTDAKLTKGPVYDYIQDNMDFIELEIKQNNRNN